MFYATGFESSVWKSVDRGESWTRLKGFNFKWGRRNCRPERIPRRSTSARMAEPFGMGPRTAIQYAIEDIVTPVMAPH